MEGVKLPLTEQVELAASADVQVLVDAENPVTFTELAVMLLDPLLK